jgi:hypothetical protein
MAWMRKHVRICGGFLALAVGAVLALPLVPGPGIPLMLVGLVLLSDHFTWAKRCLDWAEQKWKHLRTKARWH